MARWREDGRQRSKRFRLEEDAVAFEASLRDGAPPGESASPRPPTQAGGDGVYAYDASAGVHHRFVFRQSDGTLNSRRGFTTRHAAVVARRKLTAAIDRGDVRVCRELFESY